MSLLETPAPTRDRRVRRSRSALMAAAVRLVSERGTTEIAVSELAQAADVSRRLVYQRFGSRDRLLLEAALELARTSITSRGEAVPRGEPMSPPAGVLAIGAHFADHRVFYRTMLTGSVSYAFTSALNDMFVPFNREIIRQRFGDRLDPAVAEDLAVFLTGGVAAIIHAWLVAAPDPLDPAELSGRLTRLLPLVAGGSTRSATDQPATRPRRAADIAITRLSGGVVMAGSVQAPTVTTTAGTVRGRIERNVAVFRGVPFARPPVGPLRFAAPQPALPWDGIRPAESFGPPPPQSQVMGPVPEAAGSDDWLTVNVWSLSPDSRARLPVMVWIYGGAYRFGHAADLAYDGSLLAREGQVVLVTFNHRVGAEGFGQIPGVPANRGLLDQVAALEWVRDNIASFGGDPGNVTVFGESAGAGAIASLLAMPSARGLFRRAIAQSVPGTFFSSDLAADIMAEIAVRAGSEPTAAALAAITPADLVTASDKVSAQMMGYAGRWGAVAFTVTPFSPVIDGEVLPRTPWQALADGAGGEVELLTGHNQDEFRLFVAMAGLLGQVTDELAAKALATFAPDPDAYRAMFPGASAGKLFELVQSDWLFRMPTLRLAQAQAAAGGHVHVYELTWPAPGQGGALGACHGLDLPLVFGNLTGGFLTQMLIGSPVPGEAETVSRHFRSAWTAFATSGDPGWPEFDHSDRQVAIFSADLFLTDYPEEASRRLWAAHEFAALPLAPA